MSLLDKELDYYIKNQEELVKNYNGKFIAIKGLKVLGVYNSEVEAIEETAKTEVLGTFLIQEVRAGVESYTKIYHSRVAFI